MSMYQPSYRLEPNDYLFRSSLTQYESIPPDLLGIEYSRGEYYIDMHFDLLPGDHTYVPTSWYKMCHKNIVEKYNSEL